MLVYQKKAIFTQMQEYKSLFGRALDRIQTLESKHSEYDRNIAVIYQYWDQVRFLYYLLSIIRSILLI